MTKTVSVIGILVIGYYLEFGAWNLRFKNDFKEEFFMGIKWSEVAKKNFGLIINSLPQFHRTIAQQLVKESAETIAKERNSEVVEEKDLVVAFFREVPPAFKDMMKRLLNQQNVDYSKYVNE